MRATALASVAPAASALAALPPGLRDQKIVALCDVAIARLGEARDVEEVVGLRNAAEAFAVYTRKMKAAVEAQNRCELVVLLAEARIGAELKAAQERGEVERAGGDRRSTNVRGSDNGPAKLPEIGIPRQRAAEMKKLAEAGEERIRDEVARASDERRRPSRRNILGAIPTIAERPPELSQFCLWLRSGADLVRRLGGPKAFLVAMAEHRLAVDRTQLRAVAEFLHKIEE